MKLLNRLNLGTKIALFMGSLLLVVSVTMAIVFITKEATSTRENAKEAMHAGLRAMALELLESTPGISIDAIVDDRETALRWNLGEVTTTAEVVDNVKAITGSEVTLFAFDPPDGVFRRVMTTLTDATGQRAVGTPLDPDGDTHAALLAGQPFDSETEVFGERYMGGYEPIRSIDGKVVGALAASSSLDALNAQIASDIIEAVITTFALLTIGIGISYIVIRRMIGPLEKMSEVISAFANRRFEIDAPDIESQDEIGRVAQALRILRGQLVEGERLAREAAQNDKQREQQIAVQTRVVQELELGLRRLADGDLTGPIENPPSDPFPADYEALRVSYNAALDRMGIVVANVLAIGRGVREASKEISRASRELSSRAEAQAATLEQSAAALNELTASIGSTADRAAEARRASSENHSGAENGALIVQQAVSAMKGIEESSDQITRIISVIDDIAFQTNLLALNAGVEAARAGDAGRGFAVVASEVRVLARRASESAKEIKTLILESSDQVKAGSGLVGRAGDSLAEIVERAKDATGLVSDIAVAAAEQASGINELNIGINQLDEVTQQNSAMAEETTAAAAGLLKRAEDLMSALAGFQVSHATGNLAEVPRTEVQAAPQIEARVVDWSTAVGKATSRRHSTGSGVWHEF